MDSLRDFVARICSEMSKKRQPFHLPLLRLESSQLSPRKPRCSCEFARLIPPDERDDLFTGMPLVSLSPFFSVLFGLSDDFDLPTHRRLLGTSTKKTFKLNSQGPFLSYLAPPLHYRDPSHQELNHYQYPQTRRRQHQLVEMKLVDVGTSFWSRHNSHIILISCLQEDLGLVVSSSVLDNWKFFWHPLPSFYHS